MPEKPEVITVVRSLKPKIIEKEITDVKVYWNNIIAFPSVDQFQEKIKNQKILNVTCRGKWIVVHLTNDLLLIHLRMEGKFFFREIGQERNKHEHVVFTLNNQQEWRFHDVRKFGKMWLVPKETAFLEKPLSDLGLEYDSSELNGNYLYQKLKSKNIPIKTVLLDQSLIAGIGNIYDDEILFFSHLNPLKKANKLTKKQCDLVVEHTKKVLDYAVSLGGSTIRSYTSSEGVHGLFQNELQVHGKKICPNCGTKIEKIKVRGRGTYFCPKCQK